MEKKDYLDVPKPNFIVLEDLMVQSGKDIRIAALGIACHDTRKWVLHNSGPVEYKTGLACITINRPMKSFLAVKTITCFYKSFTTNVARIRHLYSSRITQKIIKKRIVKYICYCKNIYSMTTTIF